MAELMPYHNNWTTIEATMITKTSLLPGRIFVCANTKSIVNTTHTPSNSIISTDEMTIKHPVYEQDKDTLKLWINPHGLKKIQDTWYKDGQQVVTGGLHYKRTLIQVHHDPPVYGHPGINHIIQLVSHYYWWPGMCQEIKNYVQGCAYCQ